MGKNVDLNAIVETNSDEVNAAGNDEASAAAATSKSSSIPENSATAIVNRPTPTKRPSERPPVEVERGDSAAGNDTALNQTQDDTSAPSNVE